MTMTVANAIGRPTSPAARIAISLWPSPDVPVRRCTMFSVTIIAASTNKPTAIARPPSVIVFKPTLSRSSRIPARAIDIGIVRVTITAARTSPSNTNRTSTTNAAPRSTARPTPPKADWISADWSYTIRTTTPFGRLR